MIINILAASIDGLVSGIIIAGTQEKNGIKEFFKVFAIVFMCCFTTAYTGHILSLYNIRKYTSAASVIILLYLAVHPFVCRKENNSTDLYAVSFSVAADASVVCIMLAAEGYSIWLTSFLSAVTHSLFLFSGIKISEIVLREKFSRYTGYISSALFFILAMYKINTM